MLITCALLFALFYSVYVGEKQSRVAIARDMQDAMLMLEHDKNHYAGTPNSTQFKSYNTIQDSEDDRIHLIHLSLERQTPLHPDLAVHFGATSTAAQSSSHELFGAACTLRIKEDWAFHMPAEALYAMCFEYPLWDNLAAYHATHTPIVSLMVKSSGVDVQIAVRQSALDAHADGPASLLSQHVSHINELLHRITPRADTQRIHSVLGHLRDELVPRHMGRPGTEFLYTLLLEHYEDLPLTTRTWQDLVARGESRDLYFLLSQHNMQILNMIPELQLIEYVRRVHDSAHTNLVPLLSHFIQHVPMSMLSDETIDFKFKLHMLAAWVEHPSTQTSQLQTALKAMILAHPFERQKIQRHIATRAPRHGGAISLTQNTPRGNISMIADDSEVC